MNPEIDRYIEKSAEFAQPILNHIRKVVHDACPDVEEQMKWSFPNFVYKGSILCHMASFKKHCAFGFWQGALIEDTHGILNSSETNAMGNLGRISSVADLPKDDVLRTYIIQAMMLIDTGVKRSKPKTSSNSASVSHDLPECLREALEKSTKAKATFEIFSPSKRKDYIVWINEAKTEATKQKRLETAIEWLEEGKSRHWKYEKK
jgi:uncharacterized protein YdeI (YjbR/CyaY-like superfamily)